MSPPLPFDKVGTLLEQGGGVLNANLPCATWPLPVPRETASGETYDWTGQADIKAAGQIVGKPNRTIVVGGTRLKVIGAAAHEFLPHVSLQLREMRQAG